MCPAWDDEAQSTKNVFFVWMQGTHPVFTCFYQVTPSISTALHCCEGCYMLLHVVTRFAVWLGVTAHGLQSETSLNMLWVSENDAMPKLMAYHQYHQYHHIRHFLGGLPWFSMVYNDFYGESFRNRSLTVSCQVRFFVLKHWVPVCSCQCLFFGSCKIKPIHRSTNYLDLGLSQNSND